MKPNNPQSYIGKICAECGCPGIAKPLIDGYNAILEAASSVLYHFVTAGNLCQMIRNNRFTPSINEGSINGGKRFMSFSRTGNFEEGWPALFYSSSNSDDWCMIRLTVDGDRFNTHPNVKDSSGRQHPVTFKPIDWFHATGKGQGKEKMLASRESSTHKFTGKNLPDSQAHPWAQSEDRLLTSSNQIPGFLDYVKRIDIVLRKEGCTGEWNNFAGNRRSLLRNLKKIEDSGKVHVFASLADFKAGRECPVDTIGTLGETTMCESVHTARAVEVRKRVLSSVNDIKHWIDTKKMFIQHNIPLGTLRHPAIIKSGNYLSIYLSFSDDKHNKSGAQFIPTNEISIIDINIPTIINQWEHGILFNSNRNDYTVKNNHCIGTMADYISQNPEGSINEDVLNGLECLIDTGAFMSSLTHEMTHYIQLVHGEQFNALPEITKYGIKPEEYDRFKHHELMPWEIDAGVHEELARLVQLNSTMTATEMAKAIYNKYVNRFMKESGIISDERRKQCWETAVSLARAIKLASERRDVDEEDLDSIIAHIDDYAV